MTPHHCDHECVCPDKTPFKSFTNQPCNMIHCPHDTRGKTTAPAAPNLHTCIHKEIRNDVEFCHFHDKPLVDPATIRNQTLNNTITKIQSLNIAKGMRAATFKQIVIESLRTPSTQEHK